MYFIRMIKCNEIISAFDTCYSIFKILRWEDCFCEIATFVSFKLDVSQNINST